MIRNAPRDWWWTDDDAYWRLPDDLDEPKPAGCEAPAADAMPNKRWVPKPKQEWRPKPAGSDAPAGDSARSKKWVPKPLGSDAPSAGTLPQPRNSPAWKEHRHARGGKTKRGGKHNKRKATELDQHSAPNVKKSRVVSIEENDAKHVERENESAKKREESLEASNEHAELHADTDSDAEYILNFRLPGTDPWVKVEKRTKKNDARPISARE